MKGSKTVAGSDTKAESEAYRRFAEQPVFSFISLDDRLEDAFRMGFRAAHAIWLRKEELRKKRETR